MAAGVAPAGLRRRSGQVAALALLLPAGLGALLPALPLQGPGVLPALLPALPPAGLGALLRCLRQLSITLHIYVQLANLADPKTWRLVHYHVSPTHRRGPMANHWRLQIPYPPLRGPAF